MNKKIEQLIKNYDGEIYDLCYKLIVESGDFKNDFQYVCENIELKNEQKTNKIEEYFQETEIELLKKIYANVVDGLITQNISKANYGIVKPEQFYTMLWEDVCRNFKEIKELAFALYWIVIDKRIPYVYIGTPLSMDNDEFKEISKANIDSIEKIKYVLRAGYSQRTEEASILLKVITDIPNYKDQVVVFTYLISFLQETREKNKILTDLLEKIAEIIEEDD